jgi:hypothetical protein
MTNHGAAAVDIISPPGSRRQIAIPIQFGKITIPQAL